MASTPSSGQKGRGGATDRLESVPYLRLAAAQLDTVVGDLAGNVERIHASLALAEAADADLCVFPELAVTGYPPEDLLVKPRFVADNVRALQDVARATRRCAAVVGYVEPLASDGGKARLANAAALCAEGRVLGTYRKRLLPNYGVFDEQRWFVSGERPSDLFLVRGVLVGLSICEDVWFEEGPVADLGRGGAQLVVNINASPYSRHRRAERLEMLQRRVAEAGCAIAYVNQVGGQDELVFDGASLVLAADGALVAAGAQFAEDLLLVDVPVHHPASETRLPVITVSTDERRDTPKAARAPADELSPEAEVYEALVLGTRDYLAKNGFSDVVIGLSGGIDSSLVAAVAVDALGAAHVHGLSMPSRYSSEGSIADAAALAERLGIDLRVVPIERAHVALSDVLDAVLGGAPAGLTDENLQSRLRGVVLMAVSNDTGWIVLTTGNKSEMATGYSTLYGDSAGGFAVIKDVPKTLVYEVCRYRNSRDGAGGCPIPEAVLEKAPSAELRADQRDDQSLPPYEVLDPVLAAYVEQDRTPPEMIADGFDPAVVEQVVRLVDGAEYKRRQMPPGVRITMKAFGKDRRMPITNRYRPLREPSGAGDA
jgi:NAD+ synthase (glutamine-hydrolysing)